MGRKSSPVRWMFLRRWLERPPGSVRNSKDQRPPAFLEKGKGWPWPCSGKRGRMGGGRRLGNEALLGGRDLEPRLGKGSRKMVQSFLSRHTAQPSSLTSTQLCSQGAGQGSHTASSKTDKKWACRIVSPVLTDPGVARARLDEPVPTEH